MAKNTKFGIQFIKNYKMIGSVTPSSRFLTEKILHTIAFNRVKTIVEFGPGTGVFTKKILEKLAPDARLISIELNTDLFEELKKNFNDPRLVLIHGSATDLPQYLADLGITQTDVIVSSLPLAAFNESLKKEVIQTAYDSLKNKGRYLQFQYSLNARKELAEVFDKINIDFTFLNFPPAFIYICKKDKKTEE